MAYGPRQEFIKLFELYRDYVKHEDALINSRLVWNLNIQGFLFAAYGVILKSLIDVQTRSAPENSFSVQEMYVVLFVVPLNGLVASRFTRQGVCAAVRSHKALFWWSPCCCSAVRKFRN